MKWFAHFLIILIFVACGGGDGKGFDINGDRANEDEGPAPVPEAFSTRLSNSLLIAGEPCNGTETTDAEGQTFQCLPGQWMITVDTVNTCTPEGCTEVQVIPIIGDLVSVTGDGFTTFYDIRAVSPATDNVDNILEGVQVRFRDNEEPLVLYKQQF